MSLLLLSVSSKSSQRGFLSILVFFSPLKSRSLSFKIFCRQIKNIEVGMKKTKKTLLGEGERGEREVREWGRMWERGERGTRQIRTSRESERMRERVWLKARHKKLEQKIVFSSSSSSKQKCLSQQFFAHRGLTEAKNVQLMNEPETRIEVKRILCHKLFRQKMSERENNLSFNELKFRSYVFWQHH